MKTMSPMCSQSVGIDRYMTDARLKGQICTFPAYGIFDAQMRIVLAIVGALLLALPSALWSQGKASDTLVPPEVEQGELPPVVAQYESQPKTFNQYYTHTELVNGLAGLPQNRLRLMVNPDPTPSYCAPHEAREGTLFMRLTLGLDDYKFGETELLTPFNLLVTVTAYDASNNQVGTPYECTLELTTLRPEQVCRFDVSNVLANVAYFEVSSVAPYTFPVGPANINDHGIGVAATTHANLLNSLRLHVYYTERIVLAAYQKDPMDATEEDLNNPVILDVDPVGVDGGNNWIGVGALGEPITLSWNMPLGCEVDEYPSYQIQILRLFNRDSTRYPVGQNSDETSIEEVVDWRRALSFETGPLERDVNGDQIREFTLTIAEGRGYYVWRVRPIGDMYPGGIANDRNWGEWSVAPADEDILDIDGFGKTQASVNGSSMNATMRDAFFFYTQFDESLGNPERNWLFSRVFTEGEEGIRLHEGMAYLTPALRARQTQSYLRSESTVLVSEKMYDLSGRDALMTLHAPMQASGFSYREDFATYGVTDFDEDATWKNPNPMGDGVGGTLPDNFLADEYYSDDNPDKTVPTANHYPYSRTRFYPEGRVAEISGPGETFRIGGGHGGAARTTRFLYAGASEDELIAMFGDEAPAASSVRTIYGVDPNKVASVRYVSKEGRIIASALVKASSNDLMDVTLPGEAVYSESSETVVEGSTTEGTDLVYTTKVAIVTPGESIDLRYELEAATFEGCSDACETCKYKVAVKVYDAEDPSIVHYDEVMTLDALIGDLCELGLAANVVLQTNGTTNNLPVIPSFSDIGTYTVELRIITDRVDPADPLGRTFAEAAEAEYRQEVSDQIQADLLATINTYLDDSDPEGLYAWLGGYDNEAPGADLNVTPMPNEVTPEYYLITSADEADCWEIQVPVMECAEEPECNVFSIDFEAMLPAKWGPGVYNYVDKNGNATGRSFPSEAWKYFYYNGNHLPNDAPNDHGAGKFNKLVQNMVADGYTCSELLRAWNMVVASYSKAVTLDDSGDPGSPDGDHRNNVDRSVNLIEEFLRMVGKKYEGVSTNAYGTNGYIEYAYKRFQHTIARDGGGNVTGKCEKFIKDMEYAVGLTYGDPNTWGADNRDGEFIDTDDNPSNDKRWEMLYNCLSGQNKKPRGVEDIFTDCECEGVDENSSTAEKNECVLAARDKAEARCRSICEIRADGFRDEIVRMIHTAGGVIENEDDGIAGTFSVTQMEVECMIGAMIADCEEMCELTELKQDPSDVNLITGIGTTLQRSRFEQAFSWRVRTALSDPITGNCSDSMWHPHTVPDADKAVLRAMNRRLQQYREETQDVYSGKYNSDRLQEYFVELVGPYPLTEPNWSDWGTTAPEPRTLGDGECPADDQPNIFEFGPNIRAEFVLVYDPVVMGSHLAIRSWCEKDGVEYVQEVGLTEGVWWNECEVDFCMKWEEIEAPEDSDTLRPLTCEEMLARRVRSAVDEEVDETLDRLAAEYRTGYAEACLNPLTIEDKLTLTQSKKLYHFTLYYYDRAGSLVQTVPPAGVQLVPPSTGGIRFRTTHPNHNLKSTYEYNSLAQLLSKTTPDLGTMTMVYDDAGRIRMSQDASQVPGAKYSYTRYDYVGRVIEVGQCDEPAYGDEDGDTDVDTDDLRLALLDAANDPSFPPTGTERTYTRYTTPDPTTVPSYNGEYIDGTSQRYTLNRVAHEYTDDGVHTQYSYDPYGNVEWVRQHIPGLGANWVRYKYDVINGDMLRLDYNDGWEDGFKHLWKYDKDNRLVEVKTSRDGVIWEGDGRYSYYPHAVLRRAEYGEDSVHGRDIVYTLQGWPKAINHPSLDGTNYAFDPGKDGNAAGDHPNVAYDAFSMMLEYYKDDFNRANSPFSSTGLAGTALRYHLHPTKNLYNGNITSWTSNNQAVNDPLNPLQYDGQLTGFKYEYDVLNRLRLADFKIYTPAGPPMNSFVETGVGNQYNVSYTYDPNGNMTSLNRVGSTGSMDNLTYEYYPNDDRNRLRRVRDVVAAGAYGMDIDDQPDQPGTLPPDPANDYYRYDAIGNLIQDQQEGTTIQWNIYGKVKQVTKTNGEILRYTYDALGNRVLKEVVLPNGTRKTYYVHDANGMVLAIYEEECEVVVVTAPDTDRDGVPDPSDNCPTVFNPDQVDRNGTGGPGTPNGIGDACENDWDGDGLVNWMDNCPYIWDPSNTCNTTDKDGDGLVDWLDNCPCMYNPGQQNTDGDPYGNCTPGNMSGGDACDPDLDGDGIPNDHDNCPWVHNPDQKPGDPMDPHGEACEGGGCERTVEWIVYGTEVEGRIAVVKPEDIVRPFTTDRGVDLAIDPSPGPGGNIVGVPVTRILDEKTFELKDHLGNARVMISDVKIPTDVSGSPGTAQTGQAPFKNKLHAVNNYDPFGMLQDKRHWSTPDHRFGFNGKEMQNDWNDRSGAGIGTGNVYDYGFRIYDPRLGRFMSVDPLETTYPWYTPYQFAGNKPIWLIDVDGLATGSNPLNPSKEFRRLPVVRPKKKHYDGYTKKWESSETRRGTRRDWYMLNAAPYETETNTYPGMDGKPFRIPDGAVPRMAGLGPDNMNFNGKLGGFIYNGLAYAWAFDGNGYSYIPCHAAPDLDEAFDLTWWTSSSVISASPPSTTNTEPAPKRSKAKRDKPALPKPIITEPPPSPEPEVPAEVKTGEDLSYLEDVAENGWGLMTEHEGLDTRAVRIINKLLFLKKVWDVLDGIMLGTDEGYDQAGEALVEIAVGLGGKAIPGIELISIIDDLICGGCAKSALGHELGKVLKEMFKTLEDSRRRIYGPPPFPGCYRNGPPGTPPYPTMQH